MAASIPNTWWVRFLPAATRSVTILLDAVLLSRSPCRQDVLVRRRSVIAASARDPHARCYLSRPRGAAQSPTVSRRRVDVGWPAAPTCGDVLDPFTAWPAH